MSLSFVRRWGRFALLAAAVLWLLLHMGCSHVSSASDTPGDDGEHTESRQPPRSTVPPRIVQEMARISGQAPNELAGRLELREIELAPQGPRAVIAGLRERVCPEIGCPFGVFADGSAGYRPLLLVTGNTEPQVAPIGHLGHADISVSEVVSTRELRITRYQWDGWAYAPATCRVIDRMTSTARACAPRQPSEASLMDSLPASQCGAVKAMVAAAPSVLRTQALMTGGFVVRSDESMHVEAVKVKGQMDGNGPVALLRCLREAGADLKRVPSVTVTGELKTQQWSSPNARLPWGPATVSVTQTYVPRLAYTVVSVGVFGADPGKAAAPPAAATSAD